VPRERQIRFDRADWTLLAGLLDPLPGSTLRSLLLLVRGATARSHGVRRIGPELAVRAVREVVDEFERPGPVFRDDSFVVALGSPPCPP
jgi:hypothetical protein